MTHDDIWAESLRLDKERRKKLQELMEEYDSTIYYPALSKMRENCEALGHKFIFLSLNVVGNPVYICHYCGTTKIEDNV